MQLAGHTGKGCSRPARGSKQPRCVTDTTSTQRPGFAWAAPCSFACHSSKQEQQHPCKRALACHLEALCRNTRASRQFTHKLIYDNPKSPRVDCFIATRKVTVAGVSTFRSIGQSNVHYKPAGDKNACRPCGCFQRCSFGVTGTGSIAFAANDGGCQFSTCGLLSQYACALSPLTSS